MSYARIAGIAAILASVSLAGCQMAPRQQASLSPSTPQAPEETPLDGEWELSDGTGIARLSGGRFEISAADTGARLSSGSYRSSEEGVYEFSGFSDIREAEVGFNCMLVSPSQLNCTSTGGSQSVLVRQQSRTG